MDRHKLKLTSDYVNKNNLSTIKIWVLHYKKPFLQLKD